MTIGVNMKIILDADGVLLDYNEQMAKICELVYGRKFPKVAHAHHFKNAYGLELTKDELKRVYAYFDVQGWTSMPALPKTIEATQLLHSMGHQLVCLSSMPPRFVEDRKNNFKLLGMPIDEVIGSDRDEKLSHINPKAQHLIELAPDIFVDDQLRNFQDVPEKICKIWINNGFKDCPNVGMDRSMADHCYSNLYDFALDLNMNPKKFMSKQKKLKP